MDGLKTFSAYNLIGRIYEKIQNLANLRLNVNNCGENTDEKKQTVGNGV